MKPSEIFLEKPSYKEIGQRVMQQIEGGQIKLPMEDRVSVGQLIRSGNFEIAQQIADVETETIIEMATAKIYGKNTLGVYPEHIGKAPDATPGAVVEQYCQQLDQVHTSAGIRLITGQQSKKQYIAELDSAAQRFVKTQYPAIAGVKKRECKIKCAFA